MSTLDGGRRVGRYHIIRFLGAGAMGEVYLAEDPHIERQLAIKTVRIAGGRPQDIEDRKKRLLREARAAGRLLHPHVVTLFDTGEDDGLLYLAFEFVEGCDLASRLESGPPPTLREVLRIVRQVSEALDYAHRHGIVHRDIKPSNILIDTSGHVKVADFGIAKVAGQNTELTVVGSVMGSPQYLSPEQIRGDELDGRSDVFSLGVVLYELLSGKRPFDGETITTLVYQILHKDASISELRSVPLRLEQLLHHMMAKNRDDRLGTAGLVAEELAAIERELPEETLASPAAPAAETLDATRVLPSRAISPGAGSGGQQWPAAPGSPVPATAAPAAMSPLAPLAAGAAAGGTSPVGAAAPLSGVFPPSAAAAPSLAPHAAPMPPGPHPPAPAGAAAAAAPPVRRSSPAKIWLALGAVVLFFCGALGVGAFLVWQRYLRGVHPETGQSGRPAAGATTSTGAAAGPVPSATAPAGVSGSGSPGSLASTPPQAAGQPRPPSGPASPAGGAAAPGATGATGRTLATAGAPASGREPQPPPQAIVVQRLTPPSRTAAEARSATMAAGTPAAGAAGSTQSGGARPNISISSRPQPARGAQAAAGRGETASSNPGAGAASAPGTSSVGAGARSAAATTAVPGAKGPAATEDSGGASRARTAAGGAATGSGAAAAGRPQPQAVVAEAGQGAASSAVQGREAAANPAAGTGMAGAAAAASPTADQVIHSGLELAFRVNPPDAFVLLDGAVIGRAAEWSGQKGGRSFTLPGSGSHVVKIKKPGMRDYRIAIEASDTRGTTPVVVNLQPLPAAQVETVDLQTVQVREAIALRVRPEVNAVVLVDGTAAGPVKRFAGRFGHADEWLSLSPGMHRVTLVAPGYGRRDLAVEVSSGADKARQRIDIALSPATGSP